MNLIKSPFSSSSNSQSAKLSHIQSSAMTDDDKTKSLAVFKLEGLDLATNRIDGFMQDSWMPEAFIAKHEARASNKPDEAPKKRVPPPRPAPPVVQPYKSENNAARKPPLEQRFSVQPDKPAQLLKPRKPVQRSHSSAGSTNRVKREESAVIPPVVAPRNHRAVSQLPQGLKKPPLIPPAKRPSTKVQDQTGNESKVF